MQLVTLKNTTGIAQSVIYGGRQIVLPPHEEQTFEGDLAKVFLEKCSPAVVDTTEAVGKTYAPEFESDTVWVANVTGNPDLPETLRVNRYDSNIRRYKDVEVPNPLKQPRDLSRELKGNHKQYSGRDGGLVQMNLPSKRLTIPMFRRRPMPRHEADWFIERDQKSDAQGACIRSRPQSDFEPDMKWKLDDMRVYFQLMDPQADRGLDTASIVGMAKTEAKAEAEKQEWEKDEDKQAFVDDLAQKLAAEKVRAAKQHLFRRLYFRLVDPQYILPTRNEFNEFLTGKSEAEVAHEEIAELLAVADNTVKKVGRKNRAQTQEQ